MAMLMKVITKRFESARQFPAERARKELKKLKRIQKVAALRPAPQCFEEMCGWEAVYAARYGVPRFPCKHMVGNGTEVAFASQLPIVPLPDAEPKVFEGILPDGMLESVREQRHIPPRVQFGSLTHGLATDGCDVVFLDELCQEIRSLMRTPASYATVVIHLTLDYQLAMLNHDPVNTPEWRARFRVEQISKA
jgi:hypothetical protein